MSDKVPKALKKFRIFQGINREAVHSKQPRLAAAVRLPWDRIVETDSTPMGLRHLFPGAYLT
jgi:hypothetical protein